MSYTFHKLLPESIHNHGASRYARVSTYGQTLDDQLEQLRADGCAKIYREKASGAQPDRRQLLCLLKNLEAGDVWSRSLGSTAWRDLRSVR